MVDAVILSALVDSGLDGQALEWPGLRLAERTGLRLTALRRPPVAGSSPERWPLIVGEVSGSDPALCCLRPGEWLEVATPTAPRREWPAGTRAIDRSHGLAVLKVAGPCATWLLAQLCALDFHAGGHATEPRCDQTRMGHARVLQLTRPVAGGTGAEFELLVDRSLARYLWERLSAAAPHALRLAAQAEGHLPPTRNGRP